MIEITTDSVVAQQQGDELNILNDLPAGVNL